MFTPLRLMFAALFPGTSSLIMRSSPMTSIISSALSLLISIMPLLLTFNHATAAPCTSSAQQATAKMAATCKHNRQHHCRNTHLLKNHCFHNYIIFSSFQSKNSRSFTAAGATKHFMRKHSISALLRSGSRGNRTPLKMEQIKLGTPLLPCGGLLAAGEKSTHIKTYGHDRASRLEFIKLKSER